MRFRRLLCSMFGHPVSVAPASRWERCKRCRALVDAEEQAEIAQLHAW